MLGMPRRGIAPLSTNRWLLSFPKINSTSLLTSGGFLPAGQGLHGVWNVPAAKCATASDPHTVVVDPKDGEPEGCVCGAFLACIRAE